MTPRASRALLGRLLVASGVALAASSACSKGAASTSVQRDPHEEKSTTVVWKEGTTLVHQVRLASAMGPAAASASVDFVLTGRLRLSPLPAAGRDIDVRAAFDAATFDVRQGGTPEAFAALADELRAGAFLRFQPDTGSLVLGPPALSPFAAAIWQTLAAAMSFRPPPGSEEGWTVRERDGTGSYTVEYKRGDVPDRYQRRKLRYDGLDGGAFSASASGRLTPNVTSSTGEVRVKDGALADIQLDEALTVAAGTATTPAGLVSRTTLSLTLMRTEPEDVRGEWLAARGAAVEPSNVPAGGGAVNAALDEARIGHRSFEQVLTDLLQGSEASRGPVVGALPEEEKEELRSGSANLVAMAAMLRREPARVSMLTRRVREDPGGAQPLLDALGASGAKEAQGALLEIAADAKATPEFRRGAALSLIRTHHATEATVRGLISLQGDRVMGLFATYGLGTIARRLRADGELDLSERASAALIDRLRAAKGNDVIHALRGIANSGYAPALDLVRPLLESADASQRGAAVESVRLMDHAEVDGLIQARLSDAEESVRLAALNALKTRKPGQLLAEALDAVARNDSSTRCRERAVRIASAWSNERPELHALLTHVASKDASEHVRAAAQRGLTRDDPGPGGRGG